MKKQKWSRKDGTMARHLLILYVAGVCENLWCLSTRITFLAIKVWPHSGTELGPPKGQMVSAVQRREECTDAYIGTTLHKCMAQPRSASSSGQEAAVNVRFKDKGRSLQDSNGKVLAREDRNLQRGVKEDIVMGGGGVKVINLWLSQKTGQCINNNMVWR